VYLQTRFDFNHFLVEFRAGNQPRFCLNVDCSTSGIKGSAFNVSNS